MSVGFGGVEDNVFSWVESHGSGHSLGRSPDGDFVLFAHAQDQRIHLVVIPDGPDLCSVCEREREGEGGENKKKRNRGRRIGGKEKRKNQKKKNQKKKKKEKTKKKKQQKKKKQKKIKKQQKRRRSRNSR